MSPAIDPPGETFSYFWHPNNVIGSFYSPASAQVTPEGYVYRGFGELVFFTGNPLVPVDQQIKTLRQGYLRILQYGFQREGVRYAFHLFAADLGGKLERLPVNFVIVRLKNEVEEERAVFPSAAWRHSAPVNKMGGLPEYRFQQRFDLRPKDRVEGQTTFSPEWRYSYAEKALVRDGRVIYLFPADPKPYQVSLA